MANEVSLKKWHKSKILEKGKDKQDSNNLVAQNGSPR